jgi:cell division protein ZapE
MNPIALYEKNLRELRYLDHPSQRAALVDLSQIHTELCTVVNAPVQRAGFFARFSKQKRTPVAGVYLWGDVGRGKTYLMDLLYDSLPFQKKMRTHYHEFMHDIHHSLNVLPDQPNPLTKIAQDIADQAHVLCLDEFHVLDITDAMMLSGLLEALFDAGVTLATTSNLAPDDLYQDGLQRQLFLPAIALLKQHTHTIEIKAEQDYRRRNIEQFPDYYYPCDEQAETKLNQEFTVLSSELSTTENQAIQINHRKIYTRKISDETIWFDFKEICGTFRSSADYIALSKKFTFFIISNIPVLSNQNNDAVMRFIKLIDALYDSHCLIILAAETSLDELQQGSKLKTVFQRTFSRICEMQSHEYKVGGISNK